MEWRDEGILLGVRRHGESAAIIDAFTLENGRHLGLVHGGGSKKFAAILQPGAQLMLDWQARLSEHLGTFRVEPLRLRAGAIIGDKLKLAGLNCVTSMLVTFLPERETQTDIYALSCKVLDGLADGDQRWPETYARFELALMKGLGFGLDLSTCAATGTRRNLAYVSPKSGRAVSREAGGPWADRLLQLPPFLAGTAHATMPDVREALRLTGHFLDEWVMPAIGVRELPKSRARLLSEMEGTAMPPPERKNLGYRRGTEPKTDDEDHVKRYAEVRELEVPTRNNA